MGDEAVARKWYEDFLNLRKDADAGYSDLLGSQGEYAKLSKN